jgi:hypothetical protein
MPGRIGRKYIINRQTRSAARARDEFAPNVVIRLIKVASSVPRPPGVMGIAPARRATANEVNTATSVTSPERMPRARTMISTSKNPAH